MKKPQSQTERRSRKHLAHTFWKCQSHGRMQKLRHYSRLKRLPYGKCYATSRVNPGPESKGADKGQLPEARSEWFCGSGDVPVSVLMSLFIVVLRWCKSVIVWGKYPLKYLEVISHVCSLLSNGSEKSTQRERERIMRQTWKNVNKWRIAVRSIQESFVQFLQIVYKF